MKIFKSLFPKALIVFYHRVADFTVDKHKLCVTPKNFEEHIKYYSENYNVLRLPYLTDLILAKNIQSKTLVVTFDDGYADNLYAALPILEKYKVPATFFITSGYIDKNDPFYWDQDSPENDRGRTMTIKELQKLASSEIADIGAHTITHPMLSSLDLKNQRYEIEGSKFSLEKIIDKKIECFAYPFGGKNKFNYMSVDEVRNSGYKCAVTTEKKYVKNGADIFRLPRFCIKNWTIKQLHEHIAY